MLCGAPSFGKAESRNVLGEGKCCTLKNEIGVHTSLYFTNVGDVEGGILFAPDYRHPKFYLSLSSSVFREKESAKDQFSSL